ncbi:MAG: DoxX family protein [bacterium]
MSSSPLFSSTPSQQRFGITVLRVVTGIVFAAHGYQKLFSFGISGIEGGFSKMGVPLPTVTAPLISFLESFGGLALIVGLLTRLTALGLACDMLGAMLFVHMKNGFFAPEGVEFVLVLFTASLALMFAGPGRFSVDDIIASRR